MKKTIDTYQTLLSFVEKDGLNCILFSASKIFANAINDWPTSNLSDINIFIKEFEEYFGLPLSSEKIKKVKFDSKNAWQMESGASILEVVKLLGFESKEFSLHNIHESISEYYFCISTSENAFQIKLERELIELLAKFNRSNFSKGYEQIDELIFSYKPYFTRIKIESVLNEVIKGVEDEIQDELLGDFLNRLAGYCPPNRNIDW